MGGLGNQMFQYGLYRTLEFKNKSKVKANISWYLEEQHDREFELQKVFPNIQLEIDNKNLFIRKKSCYLKIRKGRDWIAFINYHLLYFCMYFKEKDDGVYDKRVFKLRNAAISGYWQTESYMKSIEDTLKRDMIFSYGEEKLETWRNRLFNDDKTVAIHIRRGDYLNNKERFENLSEGQYYKRAIELINKRVQKPHMVFFSDDISWVKRNYEYKDAIYMDESMFDHYEAWYDMCLMSHCAHNIIANSSFSWWGAWLNSREDKIVIAPGKWLKGRGTPDIWCENWIVL